MANDRNIKFNFQVDVEAKKARQEIESIVNSLNNIQTLHVKPTVDTSTLEKGKDAAFTLQKALTNAFNVDTGKLNLSKFEAELKKNNITIEQLQKNMKAIGYEGSEAFNKVASEIARAEIPVQRLSKGVQSVLGTLGNTARWQLSSSFLHGIMGAVSGAVAYAKELDDSLTAIQVVTQKSNTEMANFAKSANAAAQALSTTTNRYAQASLIYFQQGLDAEEVEKRAAITVKMANVTGDTAETVSQQLTSVWNNFYDGSKSLEYFADGMTALGAATATSSSEIAEGLQKFASIGETVGLSYEYAASALATITATTRESADTVGNALKSLFARIEGLNLGETADDGTTLNKYSAALAKVGVNIKDANGNLKDMDQILDELGERWQTLGREQQVALAQTVAGQRQYAQLMTLMNNWDFMKENLQTVASSSGTLQKQADIYAKSWEAASTRVRASLEEIYGKLVDKDFFVQAADIITSVVDRISDLIDGFGGVYGILFQIGNFVAQHFVNKTPQFIQDLTKDIDTLTGKTTQSLIKVQEEYSQLAQKNINRSFDSSDNKYLESYTNDVQENRLADISAMQLQLNQAAKDLTEEEKAQYEWEIKKAEIVYSRMEKEAKALDELTIKAMRYVEDIATDKGYDAEKLQARVEELVVERENVDQLEKSYRNMAATVKDNAKAFSAGDVLGGQDIVSDATVQKVRDFFNILKEGGHLSEAQIAEVNEVLGQTVIRSSDLTPTIKVLEQGVKQANQSFNEFAGDLKVDFEVSDDQIDAMIEKYKEADVEIVKFLKIYKDFRAEYQKPIQPGLNTVSTLQAVTSLAGAFSSLAGTINSITRVMDVFSDEDATAINKITAAIGLLTSAVFTYGSMTKAFATIQKSQIVQHYQNITAIYAESGALGVLKTATVGFGAAAKGVLGFLSAHPLILGATAIIAGITAIAVATDRAAKAFKEEQEALKGNVEEHQKLYEEAHKEIQENDKLLTSYESLLARYKETHEGKEELMSAANEVAEKFQIEGASVLVLKGQYEELTTAIYNKRKASIDAAKQDLDISKAEQGQYIENEINNGDYKTYRETENTKYAWQTADGTIINNEVFDSVEEANKRLQDLYARRLEIYDKFGTVTAAEQGKLEQELTEIDNLINEFSLGSIAAYGDTAEGYLFNFSDQINGVDEFNEQAKEAAQKVIDIWEEANKEIEIGISDVEGSRGNLQIWSEGGADNFLDTYKAIEEFKTQYVASFENATDAINTGLYKSIDEWLKKNQEMFEQYQAIIEQYDDLELTPDLDRTEQLYIAKLPEGEITNLQEYEGLLKELYAVLEKAGVAEADYDKVLQARFSNYNQYIDLATKLKAVDEIINEKNLSDAEKEWRQQAKEYIEKNRAEDLEFFAFIDFDEVKSEKELDKVLDHLRAQTENEDNITKIQSQIAVLDENKFKNNMNHKELLGFKESSGIDWDGEAEAAGLVWSKFLQANDKQRKEMLDQYYAYLEGKEKEYYTEKAQLASEDTKKARDEWIAAREARFEKEKRGPETESTRDLLKYEKELEELAKAENEARLKYDQAAKESKEAWTEVGVLNAETKDELALLQQELATTVLKAGDSLTKAQVDALKAMGVNVDNFAVTLKDGSAVVLDKAEELGNETGLAYFRGLKEKGEEINLSEVLSIDVANGLLGEELIGEDEYKQIIQILDATGQLKLTFEDLAHEDLLSQALGADKLEEYKEKMDTAEASTSQLIAQIRVGMVPADQLLSTLDQILNDEDTTVIQKVRLLTEELQKGEITAKDFLDRTKDLFTTQEQLGYILSSGTPTDAKSAEGQFSGLLELFNSGDLTISQSKAAMDGMTEAIKVLNEESALTSVEMNQFYDSALKVAQMDDQDFTLNQNIAQLQDMLAAGAIDMDRYREGVQQLVESYGEWGMTAEEVYGRLVDIEVKLYQQNGTLEDNAGNLGRQCASMENYQTLMKSLINNQASEEAQIKASNAALGKLGSQYDSCKDALKKLTVAMESNNKELQKAAESELKLSVRAEEAASTYSLEAKQIKTLAKSYQELAKQGGSAYQAAADNEEIAVDLATRYINLNKGVKNLQENWEDYEETLNELVASKDSVEAMNSVFFDHQDALNGIQTAMAQVLNISDPTSISFQFLADNADLVRQAMEGDSAAVAELQARMAEDFIMNLEINDEDFYNALNMTKSEYLNWINTLPPGELDADDSLFLEKLANLMLQSGYTVDQIEDYFAGCGIDVDFEELYDELDNVTDKAEETAVNSTNTIADAYNALSQFLPEKVKQMTDKVAQAMGIDTEMTSQTATQEDNSTFYGVQASTEPVPYHVEVPRYHFSASQDGVSYTADVAELDMNYSNITATPVPVPVKETQQKTASALRVKTANKTYGGNISHVNSTGGNKRTSTPSSTPRSSRTSAPRESTPAHVSPPTVKVHDTKFNERKTIDDYQKDKVRKETPNKKETPEEVHTSKKKYYNERYEKDATFEEKEYETKDSSIYKQFDDEIEKYHDVSNALENISHKLDEIDQRKSRAFGKAHLDALNDEKNALQEQLKLQEQYVNEMGQRSGELRQRLEQRGYTFDEDGSISNYVPQTEQNIINYNLGKEKAVEQRNKNKERWNKAYSEAYEARNQAYREITDKYNAAMQKETERYNTSVGKADDIRNAADKAAIAKYNKGLEQLAVNPKFNADSAANSEYLATMKKAVNTYNEAVTKAETERENALSQAESNRMRDLTDAYNRYIEGGNKDAYDDIVSTIENAYSNAVSLAENVYSNSMDKAADQFDKVKTKADNKLKEANEDNKEAYDLAVTELGSTLSKELADNKRIHTKSIEVAQEVFDDNTHQIKEDMQDAQDLVDAQLETATDAADKELERADRIVEIAEEGVENTYNSTEDIRQEYETLQDEIQNAMLSAQELRNKIYDNALEVIDYTLDLKVRISNEVMAALEAYLSALGDRADKAADRITNLASQMGQFAYQVGETRTAIADLLNSTGNIDQAIIDRLMTGSEASVDDLNALIAGDLFTEGKIAQLEKYRDSLVSLINEQRNLKEQMFSNIESAFNEYQDSLDRQIQRIVHLTKITDTYKNIIGIIGKKTLDATGQVSELLARQTFESQRRQTETYKTILDEIDSNLADMKYKQSQYDLDSEMYKDFQEKIDAMEDKRRSAQENWLSSWEAEMQSASDYYANAIDTITMAFETSIAGIIGSLDQLQAEMDRQKQIADVYVEDYEKIYQLNKLNRDIEDAINDSDRVKNKQQLKKLQDQINQASADGVKLSQYDLDVLRKKFELEIARNELEESKNAKSQVRMMRDAEGNYGYVYTADANAVADAEQSYEDKLHELQVLNTEYIKQLEDNYLQLQQNVRDQIANLDITQFATEEEYLAEVDRIQSAALELQKRYGQQMDNAINNNRDLYENDWATYSRLTGYKISLDEEYLDKFTETQYSVLTGYKSMEEASTAFAKSLEDAVASVTLAYEQTRAMQQTAMNDGATSMKEFAESATNATNEVGKQTQALATEAKDLSEKYRDAFSEIADKAKDFADNYTKNIQPVIDKNLELLNVISQIIEKQAGMNDETSSSTTGGQVSGTTSSGMTWTAFQTVGQAISATSKGFQNPKYSDYLPYIAALLRIDESNDYGGWGTADGNVRKARLEEVFGEGAADDIDRYLAKFGADLPTYYSAMINNGTLGRYSYERLKRIVKLDTGGYTGEWASNLGKLAFLHEKELVLNKEDTANLLTAVDMIRNIAQVIDLNARSTSQAMSSAFSAGLVQETNRNFEQDVHITAEFPNATDRDEIIAAFDNLTNLAYQLAGQQ